MSEKQEGASAQATPEAPAPAEAAQKVEAKETPQPSEQKTTESKVSADAEGEAKKEAEAKPAEDKPEKVVPEKYDLKTAENSLLDKVSLDRIALYAKEQGLSQEEAQKLVSDQEADVSAFVEERKKTWATESINDKEIGGESLKENIALSERVIEKWASPALKAELNKTGYGNHPELVRMFVRLGKAMGEDKAVIPNAQVSKTKSMEELFYDNTKS